MNKTRSLLGTAKRLALRTHARKPKPARRARRASPRGENPTLDERLAPIASDVLEGTHIDCAWELFRSEHFPDWPHERIAAMLGMWSTRRGIKVIFEARTVNDLPVIWVCFGKLTA